MDDLRQEASSESLLGPLPKEVEALRLPGPDPLVSPILVSNISAFMPRASLSYVWFVSRAKSFIRHPESHTHPVS